MADVTEKTAKESKKRTRESDAESTKKKSKRTNAQPETQDAMAEIEASSKKVKRSKKRDPESSEGRKIKKTKRSEASEDGEQPFATPGNISLFAAPVDGLDSAVASLFSSSANVPTNEAFMPRPKAQKRAPKITAEVDVTDLTSETSGQTSHLKESGQELPNDAELSSLGSDADADSDIVSRQGDDPEADDSAAIAERAAPKQTKRKRNHSDDVDDELEVRHLKKLSVAVEKDIAKSKGSGEAEADASSVSDDDAPEATTGDAKVNDDAYIPPQHESLSTDNSASDFEQAARTVFLGNVSTSAIKSKTDRKVLEAHLKSFFPLLPKSSDAGTPPPALVSLRFRSTPFATSIPRRAAFARKDLMDATTHSTNAYAVYSASSVAQQAVKHLNATVVLSRHLRVDSVAHPAPTDHKRCVFVGNLGFVDDETAMDQADPHQTRKTRKTPSDIEEGLWRTFATVGRVQSVRVVRDAATRVGKGFAYVQFSDENGVEGALAQLDGNKYPPLLPRKLRLARAKAVKRNAAASSSQQRLAARKTGAGGRGGGRYGDKSKLTPQQQSQMGRAAKLLGKAAAGQMKGRTKDAVRAGGQDLFVERSLRRPEEFVFEGNRARSGETTGVKMKKGSGKKAKPTKSSGKRAAAWKTKRKTAA